MNSFFKNDEFAGHVIVIDGQGYEFFREAEPSDLWWAGIKINSPASKPPSINNAIHEKEDKHTQG